MKQPRAVTPFIASELPSRACIAKLKVVLGLGAMLAVGAYSAGSSASRGTYRLGSFGGSFGFFFGTMDLSDFVCLISKFSEQSWVGFYFDRDLACSCFSSSLVCLSGSSCFSFVYPIWMPSVPDPAPTRTQAYLAQKSSPGLKGSSMSFGMDLASQRLSLRQIFLILECARTQTAVSIKVNRISYNFVYFQHSQQRSITIIDHFELLRSKGICRMPWGVFFYALWIVEYRTLCSFVFRLRVSWKQNIFATSISPIMYKYLCENDSIGCIFMTSAVQNTIQFWVETAPSIANTFLPSTLSCTNFTSPHLFSFFKSRILNALKKSTCCRFVCIPMGQRVYIQIFDCKLNYSLYSYNWGSDQRLYCSFQFGPVVLDFRCPQASQEITHPTLIELLWPMSQSNFVFKCLLSQFEDLRRSPLSGDHCNSHGKPHQIFRVLFLELLAWLMDFASMDCPRIPEDHVSGIALNEYAFVPLDVRILIKELHPIGIMHLHCWVPLAQLSLNRFAIGSWHNHESSDLTCPDSLQWHHPLHTFEAFLEVGVLVNVQVLYEWFPSLIDPPWLPTDEGVEAGDQVFVFPDLREH